MVCSSIDVDCAGLALWQLLGLIWKARLAGKARPGLDPLKFELRIHLDRDHHFVTTDDTPLLSSHTPVAHFLIFCFQFYLLGVLRFLIHSLELHRDLANTPYYLRIMQPMSHP